MGTQRLFIGIELSDEVRAAACKHIEALRQAFPELRVGWEARDKLHITMQFLGDVEETLVPAIQGAVHEAASAERAFESEIAGTGAFGRTRAPRVLWLGVGKGSSEVTRIANSLEEKLTPIGFNPESREFSPHVTVARIKEPHRSADLAVRHLEMEFVPVSFRVEYVTIFKSVLSTRGSTYSVLSRHHLLAGTT